MELESKERTEFVALRNDVEVLKHVVGAIIETHPDRHALWLQWQRTTEQAVEQARPKSGHVGLPTELERRYTAFQQWSDRLQPPRE